MSDQNQILKKPFARKFGLIIAAILLLAGLFVVYRYWSGNIDGTWMIEDYSFYIEEEDRWVTKEENQASMKEQGITYEDHLFRTVEAGRIKDFGYHKFGSEPYELGVDSYFPEMRQVNKLSHKIELFISDSDYDNQVDKALKMYYQGWEDSSVIEQEKKNYMESKDNVQSFQRKGNRLYVTINNKQGKKIAQHTYRLLSKEEADKELAKFDKIRKEFEKRAGIKSKN